MTKLELTHILETNFRSFGYKNVPTSDDICLDPYEAISSGLNTLELGGIISREERLEHSKIYEGWNASSLNDQVNLEQLEALKRVLEYWFERNIKEISSED